jgi:predicted nucleotidyltransferase
MATTTTACTATATAQQLVCQPKPLSPGQVVCGDLRCARGYDGVCERRSVGQPVAWLNPGACQTDCVAGETECTAPGANSYRTCTAGVWSATTTTCGDATSCFGSLIAGRSSLPGGDSVRRPWGGGAVHRPGMAFVRYHPFVNADAPSLLEKLRAAVASGPPLRIAVLFGSQATGKALAGSDVDVGILPLDPAMSMGEELAFASALSAVTGTEVDLVRLDDAPPASACSRRCPAPSRRGEPRRCPSGWTSTR